MCRPAGRATWNVVTTAYSKSSAVFGRQHPPHAERYAMAEEFGDYLFTLTEYGRRLGLKANACLDVANNKFLARYKAMERLALERGLSLDALDMAAKNALWEEVKKG